MSEKEAIRVDIQMLTDPLAQDAVLFTIHEMTATYERAIELLKQSTSKLLVNEMNSDKQYQLSFNDVLYLDYVDRTICFYTKERAYWLKCSFVQIMEVAPEYLVQISKTIAVNLYEIQSFKALLNGNLVLELSSKEQVIVSRRYAKSLKTTLQKLINNQM